MENVRKKENFFKLNGFDERIFLYHDDDDISIRLKREIGPLMYINNSEIVHLAGRSSSRDKEIASIIFNGKYNSKIKTTLSWFFLSNILKKFFNTPKIHLIKNCYNIYEILHKLKFGKIENLNYLFCYYKIFHSY